MRMDFFADNLVKKCIGQIIDNKGRIKDDVAIWKTMTRRLFMNYPTIEVWSWVEKASEEAADEFWFENKYPKEVFMQKFVREKKPRSQLFLSKLKRGKTKKLINDNLKISDVIKSYGIKLKGKICICPFHKDTAPSLSFSDDKNVFNCFGCGAKGDVIKFIRMMEDDNNTTSRK